MTLDKCATLLIIVGFTGMVATWAMNAPIAPAKAVEGEITMEQLLAQVETEFSARDRAQKATALMDLWNISEADIARPVDIFGESGDKK